MAHVFVTGLATLDTIYHLDALPIGGDKFRANEAVITGGGGGANAAVTVARLGGTASLATRMGQDHIGDMILAGLEAENVDLSPVHRTATDRSAFSSIYVTPGGERQVVNFRGEALSGNAEELQLPQSVDAALADTRWHAGTARTLDLAKSRDIPGIVDAEAPIDLDQIAAASHVAFSEQGLIQLTGDTDILSALKTASHAIKAWVCVTAGRSGVYCMVKGQIENIPSFEVTASDTLAAGDVWHGAFALKLAEGADELTSAEFANAAAALKCQHFGGRLGCPNRAETDDLVRHGSR
ncbi:MAG: sugar kinase [Rhodobacteraceae bacterium]|nr:MAG: sugar kinase [Paracoccaceae bacterium]